MTQSKITPGPWETVEYLNVNRAGTELPEIFVATNYGNALGVKNRTIAVIAGSYYHKDKDKLSANRANARAIAAVPDMIGALTATCQYLTKKAQDCKDMAKNLPDGFERDQEESWACEFITIREQLRPALRKAGVIE